MRAAEHRHELPALPAPGGGFVQGRQRQREFDREEGGQISERSESHTEKSGLYPINSREQLETCE